MTIKDLLQQLKETPKNIEFTQVMDVISQEYSYTPSSFTNGSITNEAGTNEGSCKIFYFAQLQQLTEAETLALFGSFYRDDVLAHPNNHDHGNIRNFISTGWTGIKFDGEVLTK